MANQEMIDGKEKKRHTEHKVSLTLRSVMPHVTQFNYRNMRRALRAEEAMYLAKKENPDLPSEVYDRLWEMGEALGEANRSENTDEELSRVKVAILTLTDLLNTFGKYDELEPFPILSYIKRDLPIAEYNLENDIPPPNRSSGSPSR